MQQSETFLWQSHTVDDLFLPAMLYPPDDSPDLPERIAADIDAIAGISAVPKILSYICEQTGMGYAAIARVTDGDWTACAVHDAIGFGLGVGGRLDVSTTLCQRARELQTPVAFDHASLDPVYKDHHTPRIYGLESYVSVPLLRRDGTYFGNLCAIDPKPHAVANDHTLEMFKLFADIVSANLESEDRHHATQSALDTANETATLREQFIAVMGHDLRNPVAAVKGLAHLLERNAAEPIGKKVGTRLRHIADRMQDLLHDSLDLARGRIGTGLDVQMASESELGESLRLVVQELREANPGRQLLDRIDVDGDVWCDAGRIQQLLANLVANAITHGATAEPVEIEATRNEGFLSMSVLNGGDPIPPDHLGKLFDPYWRPAESRGAGGLGLGLFICSEIVRAHQGSIEVASSGSGTRFDVRIPVSASSFA